MKYFPIMANRQLYFSELKASSCRKVVVTRLFLFTETWNIKRCVELMDVDLRMVDRKVIIRTIYFDLKTCTSSGLSFLPVFLYGCSQQSNIVAPRHRYRRHVPYGRHNQSVFELKYWWYDSAVWAMLRAYYPASCQFDWVSSFFYFVCIYMPILKMDLNP